VRQTIICLDCYHPLKKYPGEWNESKLGTAKDDFLCDLCGNDIPKGTACYAQSMGMNFHPYWEWEDIYIEFGLTEEDLKTAKKVKQKIEGVK
jgi:hypothetical protein